MAAQVAQKLGVLEFILAERPPVMQGVCILAGDDDYLKDLAWHHVLAVAKVESGAVRTLVGREAQWRDVADVLGARSLFDPGPAVALIEEADTFVTAHRPQLEAWFAEPHQQSLLILDVRTWASNTRVAKAAATHGPVIDCTVPEKGADLTKFKKLAARWLTERATRLQQVAIDPRAIDALMDLLPLSIGIMDQEIARLALLTDTGRIDQQLVIDHVGGWRTRTTWDAIDAAVEGRTADALAQLDRLIASGEEPIPLLAQVSSTLRKFVIAGMCVSQAEAAGQRASLGAAVERAGFPPFIRGKAEQQLKAIGRIRAAQMADWLLETDLAMKGHNSQPAKARLELERLLVRLAGELDPRRRTA